MFPKKKENPKEDQPPKEGQQKPQTPTQEAQELQKQIEELRVQAEELQKGKDDIFAKLQRVAADYDNYQKRSARQITDSIAYERDKIIKALLPVLDDFERVLAHSENAESVVEGVKLVYEHFKGVLRSQGVEQIEAAGERFDPTMHEAIVQQSDASKEDGVVLEELQKGYRMNGRMIRASRVVVNKAAEEPGLDELSSRRSAEPEPGGQDETKDTQ